MYFGANGRGRARFYAVRELKFCKILNENRKILSKIYSKIIKRQNLPSISARKI